jgi:hypothetical protein
MISARVRWRPSVAAGGSGAAAVVWQPASGGLDAVTRQSGGEWSAPSSVYAGMLFNPEVVVDDSGTTTVSFSPYLGDENNPLDATELIPGGSWTTPVLLVPADGTSTGEMVVDPGGDVDVLRATRGEDAEYIVSATEDVAGPALNGLSVPASGTVGVPVLFSVAPLDAWSPIGVTTWDFGDGQSLPDESVSHTYTAPGTYTVHTSSSDALGNATSHDSTIVVAPAAGTSTSTAMPTPSPRAATALTLRVTHAHRRWREAIHGAALTAALRRVPLGTHFGVTVNEAARVTFTFGQAEPGRRIGGRCRALTTRDRHDGRCTRTVLRGTLSIRITAAGRRSVKVTGRIGRRRLPAGGYTVTVHATGSGGSATRRLRFTIAGLAGSADQPEPLGALNRLGAVAHAELAVDRARVLLDRVA